MAASSAICEFGWRARDAALMAADGRMYHVLDCAGPRGLVVAFISNHCPYVKVVIRRVVRDAENLRQHGIGFVAINSNDADSYPEDSYPNMRIFADEYSLSFPYLHDADQSLARAYNAVCTPDFFGFDASLGLQHRGRLDASRKEQNVPGLRRDLFEAMVQIVDCGRGPERQHPSIGCSLKWIDNERAKVEF